MGVPWEAISWAFADAFFRAETTTFVSNAEVAVAKKIFIILVHILVVFAQ